MTTSKQININQHAYKSGHSTVTAMMQISNSIYEGVEDNSITTANTIDETVVFDCNYYGTRQDTGLVQFPPGIQGLDYQLIVLQVPICHDRDQGISPQTSNLTTGVPQFHNLQIKC